MKNTPCVSPLQKHQKMMEIHPADMNFKMMVNVPVAPPDFYRLNEEARVSRISVAELIRRKLGIFSIAQRNKIINHKSLQNG